MSQTKIGFAVFSDSDETDLQRNLNDWIDQELRYGRAVEILNMTQSSATPYDPAPEGASIIWPQITITIYYRVSDKNLMDEILYELDKLDKTGGEN